MSAQRAGDGMAIHAGQLDIKQDHVEPSTARQGEPAGTIRRVDHAVALLLQKKREQVPILFVVFDQKDFHGARMGSGATGAASDPAATSARPAEEAAVGAPVAGGMVVRPGGRQGRVRVKTLPRPRWLST